jgi:hypothetical protein
MTISRGNNSEKRKKQKRREEQNFEGSDKCLSAKLTRRKHLKRRKLEAKIRIVFFLIHQIKILSSKKKKKNYKQQMSHQNSKENFLPQTILEK